MPSLTLRKSSSDPHTRTLTPYPVTSSYYIVGIPMGVYLTFWQDMELWGLWIGLTAAMVCNSTIGGRIVLGADWDREVEKVVERSKGDGKVGNRGESTESA